MNIEEQKKLLAMKRTTRSQLHDREGLWEGRLWEICQLTNRKFIRGRWSGTRWHNIPKSCHSTPAVNETVGQRRDQCLPMEICLALRLVKTRSAQCGNTMGDEAEVSRGHMSWAKTSRGVAMNAARLNYETRGITTQ